jgi:TolA-binding protein
MNQRSPTVQLVSEAQAGSVARIGAQPIVLAIATFAIIVAGVVSIALWRSYTGTSPELDRVVAARQLQAARAAQVAEASEQLAETTKGLEATQQESIDQLQVVQDQLQTVKRLLASQQTDTKRLSEQVATLTESIDGLKQSFASSQATETESPSATRRKPARRTHASLRKRSRSRS